MLFYKNFFVVSIYEQEKDIVMDILDQEKYRTYFYTYKGLCIEAGSRAWTENPEAIDAYNNRAYLYDADREELEKTGSHESGI